VKWIGYATRGQTLYLRFARNRALLLAVAFEYGGIQIQRVALRAQGQALHLPFRERLVEALDISHAEFPKQVADR
jgi:hypothetical protein